MSIARSERGSVITEVAASFLLFCTVVFGGIDLARLVWTSVTLQHAVADSVRFGTLLRPLDPTVRAQQMRSRIQAWSPVPLQSNDIDICVLDNTGNCSAVRNAGQANQHVRVEVNFNLRGAFLPFGKRVQVVANARNQPFQGT